MASVDENGVVIGTTPGAPGVGYSVAPNLPTTSGNGCTINITAVSMISLTLDRPYEGNGVDPQGTGYLAYPYVYMQNVYTLPIDVSTVTSILDPVTGIPLTPFSKDNLDESVGPRTLVQNPNGWAIYDDTNETAPPTQHQVELYPPPLYARGFPVEYTHAAIGFDGVAHRLAERDSMPGRKAGQNRAVARRPSTSPSIATTSDAIRSPRNSRRPCSRAMSPGPRDLGRRRPLHGPHHQGLAR